MTRTPTIPVRAPYTQVSVQLDAPDAPYHDAVVVSWAARRFTDGGCVVDAYQHLDGSCTILAHADNLAALPVVPAWVPGPPAGWLASLHATALEAVSA
jgi:hypothetical protein